MGGKRHARSIRGCIGLLYLGKRLDELGKGNIEFEDKPAFRLQEALTAPCLLNQLRWSVV